MSTQSIRFRIGLALFTEFASGELLPACLGGLGLGPGATGVAVALIVALAESLDEQGQHGDWVTRERRLVIWRRARQRAFDIAVRVCPLVTCLAR